MDQIRLREPRFHEHAYLFVLSALEFSQSRLPERRHITGRELAEACRDLALDRYGVMARLVLDHWGVRSTADIGDVVFTLVDLGLLISQPTDSRLDFADVFGFDQAFERSGVTRPEQCITSPLSRRASMTQDRRSVNSTELPVCRKCHEGSLLPLSDYGKDGAPITYKAWVCSNPECGFNLRIDNGEISFGRSVGQSHK